MNKKVKRVVSSTDYFEIFQGRIMARLRNMVPNGRRTALYHLTCFINSQMLSVFINSQCQLDLEVFIGQMVSE